MTDPYSDTIVARATPPGAGAVAIVRASGPQAITALQQCFEPASRKPAASHHLAFGHWRRPDGSEVIDSVLAVRMDGPHSYTGEDVVEVHCHGGGAVVEAIVDSFIACGARHARPGEFTRRAFLNGRMDLAQAEAVADLVAARTDRARQAAVRQLEGELSRRIGRARERLIAVIAEMEAYLDFSEEDLAAPDPARWAGEIESLRAETARLADQGRRGRFLREGLRVVIAGAPNVGKSSLFNALVGMERALVSPHPGTTRDTIEATLEIDGLAVTLVDTAGLRDADAGEIERMGIARAQREIDAADLVLWLEVAQTPPPSEEHAFSPTPPPPERRRLRIGAKSDLARPDDIDTIGDRFDVLVSSATGAGLPDLERLLSERLRAVLGHNAEEVDPLVTHRRHVAAFAQTANALARALESLAAGESSEFAVADLRSALDSLNSILGVETGEAILDAIFSRFCIGK